MILLHRPKPPRRVRGLVLVLALLLAATACAGADQAADAGLEAAEATAGDDAATGAATDDEVPADATATAAAAAEAEAEAEDFYQPGDTIQLVVPFSPGGGTDTIARVIAPNLSDCLGADVQVVNVPGGGSVLGANEYVNQMEHDGYNLLMTSSSTHVPPIVGQQGVSYAFSDLEPVAGFPLGSVLYASPDTAIDEAVDLTEPHQPESILYGGMPPAGGDLSMLLFFEMFGTDVRTVLGYEGRGPARLAFERGESDISYDTAPAYTANVEPMVDEGRAVPLMSFGQVRQGELVDDPAFPELPNPAEVYEEAFGESPEGLPAFEAYKTMALATVALNKAMAIHEDAPAAAIAELESCWSELATDQDFLDRVEVELGGSEVLVGEDVEDAWAAIAGVDRDDPTVEWLLGWVEENYDVRLDDPAEG